jgi:hypothetical protein
VADFREGQELWLRGSPSKKMLQEKCLQFGGGILLYVDGRKVPHAGEKRGDVGGLLGVAGGLRWREKKSASL